MHKDRSFSILNLSVSVLCVRGKEIALFLCMCVHAHIFCLLRLSRNSVFPLLAVESKIRFCSQDHSTWAEGCSASDSYSGTQTPSICAYALVYAYGSHLTHPGDNIAYFLYWLCKTVTYTSLLSLLY